MACTGIEFCKLAIGETKGRAMWLTEELAARLPGFDEDPYRRERFPEFVRAVPGRRYRVDVGAAAADGRDAVGCVLGRPRRRHGRGRRARPQGEGRERIFAEDSADYLALLLTRYQQQRGTHTSFGAFVNALDDEQLARFAAPVEVLDEHAPSGAVDRPFCGEQDLRPDDPSGWRCLACDRRFELTVTGVGEPT